MTCRVWKEEVFKSRWKIKLWSLIVDKRRPGVRSRAKDVVCALTSYLYLRYISTSATVARCFRMMVADVNDFSNILTCKISRFLMIHTVVNLCIKFKHFVITFIFKQRLLKNRKLFIQKSSSKQNMLKYIPNKVMLKKLCMNLQQCTTINQFTIVDWSCTCQDRVPPVFKLVLINNLLSSEEKESFFKQNSDDWIHLRYNMIWW